MIVLIFISFLFLGCASQPELTRVEPRRKPQSEIAVEKSGNSKTDGSAQNVQSGCDSSVRLSHNERLAIIEKIISETDAEVEKNTDQFLSQDVRARVGTFSAGLIGDDVPFVSIDRTCWSDFYEAEQALLKNDESAAHVAAKNWGVCVRASFPDRLELAKPFFSCFPGLEAKTSKAKSK